MQPHQTISWNVPLQNNRFSILFVDDELYAQKSIRKVLESAGYVVHTTGNREDALQILETNHIHLGIYDLNLAGDQEAVDDIQIKNHDGLDLASNPVFPELRMIYTGQEDRQLIVEAMALPKVVNYIIKGEDGPNDLLEKVGIALHNNLPLNQDLCITWDSITLQALVQAIYPGLTLTEQVAHLYELEDLFRMQFFRSGKDIYNTITIQPLTSDMAHRVWLKVSAFTDRERQFDSLVLVGSRELIAHESQQFEQLSPLANQMRTEPVQTVHYGLHVYDMYNQQLPHIETLVQFGQMHAIENIYQVISKTYSNRFQHHYRREVGEETGELYTLALGDNIPVEWKMTEILFESTQQLVQDWQQVIPQYQLHLDQGNVEYGVGRKLYTVPNPVIYFNTMSTQQVTRPTGWTMGNLTLASMFNNIETNEHYLLDYTDACQASVLRDFVTMERSIHIYLLSQVRIESYAIFSSQTFQTTSTPQLMASIDLIEQVRALAQRETGCTMEAYQQDLYIDLMDYLMTYPEQGRASYYTLRQYAHCFLMAGQICHDLQQAGVLSETETDPRDGLWIYDEDAILRRLGKEVQLTEKQFGIFTLLYKEMGTEFSYAEIIKDGLGEDYLHDDIDLEKPRIQTAMSRLRTKLQEFGFEIEAGREGYRLVRTKQ